MGEVVDKTLSKQALLSQLTFPMPLILSLLGISFESNTTLHKFILFLILELIWICKNNKMLVPVTLSITLTF